MPEYRHCQSVIPISMHPELIKRLEKLLNGRRKYPWGQSITLSRGAIDKLFNGDILHHQMMGAITRAENVSLSWLTEGRGSPYMVNRVSTDKEAADNIRDILEDEPGTWTIYDVRNKEDYRQSIVVLTQPGEYSYEHRRKQSNLTYKIVEIISGPLGKRVYELTKEHSPISVTMPYEKFEMLARGWTGNYELLGSDDNEGLLSKYKTPGFIAENYAPLYATGQAQGEEQKYSSLFKNLSAEDQDALIRIAEALVQIHKD